MIALLLLGLQDLRAHEEAARADAKTVDGHSRRGDARFFLGDFEGAVADYERMVELEPRLEAGHWRRGIAYFYAGRYEKAARQFEIYHSFDDVDRENGIWRYFSQAKAYGFERAREGLLKYKKDDREPFPSVYELFAGRTTPEAILAPIKEAPIDDDEREKRHFYAHLYIGLNHAVEGRAREAAKFLRLSTANRWGPLAGFGPSYMWHVGRLHLELLDRARDWPGWRGPEGSGVSSEGSLPAGWGPRENVGWRAEIPGEGASSPIVSGDAVFVTSALEGGGRRLLHCLDRKTGKIRWTRETKDANPEIASAVTGHAASTPATDGRRVVAWFGNAGVVCYDFAGELLWRRRLGDFESELGLASSPVLHRGKAILVCDHDGRPPRSFDSFLAALDLRTGEPVWRTERPGLERSWSTPVLVGQDLVVSAQDEVRGYDPATGKLAWKVDTGGGWVTPTPVAGLGLVVATSGKDGPTLAFRPGGEVVWREARGGPYVCSPLLLGDLLYLHDETGILVCRNAADGKEVYRERLSGKFSASAVAGDGKLYFTSEAGTTYVVKPGRSFELLAENRLGEEVLASPAIARGALFIRTAKRLWCLRSSAEE